MSAKLFVMFALRLAVSIRAIITHAAPNVLAEFIILVVQCVAHRLADSMFAAIRVSASDVNVPSVIRPGIASL